MADAGPPATRLTPSQAYEAGVAEGRWQSDPAQRTVLPALDRIHANLRHRHRRGWLGRLIERPSPLTSPQGLYLWGGVGRGKTFLVDLLANTLPPDQVLRRHFHRFMSKVHAALQPLREAERSDPLAAVAERIANRCRVLCLDEFVVHDIGDAMILSGLLDALIDEGVTLVTTSNTAPGQLYRDGLQRPRFEPAIALLQRHCQVIELVSPTDHRLRNLTRAPVFIVPAGPEADQQLQVRFNQLAPDAHSLDTALRIEGRDLPARALSEGVAWFDFDALCEGPRAVADYIALARRFNTVLISGVPVFGAPTRDDAAKRFIHLIDEFYDRRVKLLLSADAAANALYANGRLRSQFERTESRLIEMQSTDYLAEAHRP